MANNRPSDAFAATASPDIAGPSMGQLILRRKWLLLFGICMGVGLGYLFFTQQPPVFQSYAWIQVTPNQMQLPTVQFQPGQMMSMAIETQCDAIRSRTVLSDAVEQGNLGDRPEFGSPAAALSAVAGGLTVAPLRESSQTIQISYIGSSPTETKAVVDAVVKAYRDYIGSADQNKSKSLVDMVTYARDDLLKDIKALGEKLHQAQKQTSLLSQAEDPTNPFAERLVSIEAKKTAVILHRTELQSRIGVITDALERGGSREALSLMIDQLQGDEPTSEAAVVTDKLFPLMLERELLSERLGPDHPDLQSIDRQIEMTQAHLNKVLDLKSGARRPKDLLALYLDSIRYEIKGTQLEEQNLEELYNEQERKAQDLQQEINTLQTIREDIRRKDQLLNAIVRHLEEMDLFDAQGIVTDVTTSAYEGVRTDLGLPKYLCVGGALGLIISAILAYLLESSDKSFRTPEDIRDELGLSVVGHVPVIPAKMAIAGSSASPALCTLHSPRGQSSEAFRLVRTALFFGARSGTLRVIQITSPEQGDGKSTMAANLAVAVAQSGRRTLLIDADMRRPTAHRMFGMKNDVGIADVIGNNLDPQDAIREAETPNLSVMLCGPHPRNPAELLASRQFDEFLGWARDNYDFVIVDTPPLLAVSDPGNVASRVDGVLLTLRLGKQTRVKAVAACEALERVGANMLGVIVNGVNSGGENGYTSNYRFTYASASHYGYTDVYSPSEEEVADGMDLRMSNSGPNGNGVGTRIGSP